MITENKRMEAWRQGISWIGHIMLDRLAIPETVKVTLLGEEIIPASFDCFGHPNFSEEQQMLYLYKSEEYRRKHGENAVLKAEIIYTERHFDVPRDSFDSIEGISKSLTSLSDLNEMLNNRRMFRMAHPDEYLNKYMIFGCFLLGRFGKNMSVRKSDKNKMVSIGNVETYENFLENNEDFRLTDGGYVIPSANSVCPCCGKQFTIEDLSKNPCVLEEGKCYHESCWKEYSALTGIDKLTRRLMSLLYKFKDYNYELLPNTWPDCEHIPSVLFHTIDGDIIMSWGWRERVISIEWQENYKPFDMEKLFGDERVDKWDKDGKRGIYAWSSEKAFDYLQAVRKEVNPKYSMYRQ